MNIEWLKRWHWCLIGLAAGLLLAFAKLSVSPQKLPRSMGIAEFEQALRSPPVAGHPVLADLLVRPVEKGTQLVTGQHLIKLQTHDYIYSPFSFAAPVPYPISNAGNGATKVEDRIAQAQHQNPLLQFRFGWWLSPKVAFVLWTGGAMFVIGGIWPTLLALLLGAGLGPKRFDPKYDLNRFANEQNKKQTPREFPMTDDDGGNEKESIALAVPATIAEDITATASPVLLSGAPPGTVVPIQCEEEAKEFKGEFYPTIVHAPKREPESGETSI